MQEPLRNGVRSLSAPHFYITGREPIRPGAIVLATVAAVVALSSVLYALGHNGAAHLAADNSGDGRSASTTPGASAADDEKDDPSQIDTIVLGDPADAPVPARRGDHVSPVHPTILVHLPRFGDQVGLIPDTPAGRLLYGWLAAFNQASYPALGNALPNVALASLPLHRSSCGSRPAALICSLPRRYSRAFLCSGCAIRRPWRSRLWVPFRCVRTQALPPSRVSVSAPFPQFVRAPLRGPIHSRQHPSDE